MGDRHGSIGIGLAVVRRVAAPFGEFVGDQRNLFVLLFIHGRLGSGTGGSAWGQHADEVAIPHRAFGQFFALATSRAEQIAQHHRFEFGPKLVLGRN